MTRLTNRLSWAVAALLSVGVAWQEARANGAPPRVCVDWNGDVVCSEVGPFDPQTYAIEVCGNGRQGRLVFFTNLNKNVLTYGPIYFQDFRIAADGVTPIYVATDNVIMLDSFEECRVTVFVQPAP